MKKIYVLGSVNFDLTIYTDRLPCVGETVSGYDFMSNSGGKGANQAVAVSKLGGDACLIASVGKDFFGQQCLEILKKFGVDLNFVQLSETNTGTAVVIIKDADNRIIIDHGANFALQPHYVEKVIRENVREGDVFVTQMEMLCDCVEAGLKAAKEMGAITVLNPAPAQGVTDAMLQYSDYVIPNESEAKDICGIKPENLRDLCKIDETLRAKGVKKVIVTLGDKGCYYDGKIYPVVIPVEAVDTTAAGDTFVGALCVRLAEGAAVEDSLAFCQTASGITVTRRGAQVAIPYLEELKQVV
ncbi:MAG: ribokinase [Corallococcus sp.]|nr:ribokinase [Corallococcus sp.]MCM1359820.1 ribokinase [Corallococcus sp.]MCM1395254.1 ribokinase [Corallococcus sp.]